MDSMSMSSVSEQARDNINKKFLLPRKPARLPNPIINRRLRRGSAAARIQGKQTEYPTDKELLRTIVYLRNATAVFYEPDKTLSYNKGHIHDDDDDDDEEEEEEENNSLSHGENGKHELDMSIQKYSKNLSQTMIKNKEKKRRVTVKENKEHDVASSTSHVVLNFKDMNDPSYQGKELTKTLEKYDSTCKSFLQFCSTEIICPPEHRAALAVKLYGVQAALLSALGSPFENLSQSTSSSSSNSHIVQLSIGQASIKFLPAMIWTGMFISTLVYTVMVVWSLTFRIPIISMLCLSLLYSLSVLVAAASGFDVIYGTFTIHAILFTSLGVLGFVMLLVGLVVLVLFASWRCKK